MPTSTGCGRSRPPPRSRNTKLRSPACSTAESGTIRRSCGAVSSWTVANMSGRSARPRSRARRARARCACSRRRSGRRHATVPSKRRPGSARHLDRRPHALRHQREVLLVDLRLDPDAVERRDAIEALARLDGAARDDVLLDDVAAARASGSGAARAARRSRAMRSRSARRDVPERAGGSAPRAPGSRRDRARRSRARAPARGARRRYSLCAAYSSGL